LLVFISSNILEGTHDTVRHAAKTANRIRLLPIFFVFYNESPSSVIVKQR